MKMLSLVRSGAAALALCSSSNLLADALLNGLAIHKEFGKEMFIGALYTDQLTREASELLAGGDDKRLELRVTSKRLSSRRLNSLWIEGMAINIPPARLASEAENMVQFANLLRGKRLKRGDILSISSAVGEGTRVELNGVEMGRVESDDFGTLLLSTWIGSVPLSSEFREELLHAGDISEDLLARFEEVAPSAERRTQVRQWKNPAPAPVLAIVAAPELAVPAAEALTVAKAPVISAPVLQAPAAGPSKAPAEPPVQLALAVTQDLNIDADALEDELLEDELGDEDYEEAAPLLTAESLLSRQLFHSSLLKWTYKHIRYPNRAIERGQEGSVRISVVIDRDGKILTSTEVESSRFSSLNKAAMKAVKKASPFPPMPDDIQGEQFAFSLPVLFQLPK